MTDELVIKLARYLWVLKQNSGDRRLSQNDSARIKEIIETEVDHYLISNLSSLHDFHIEVLGYTRRGLKQKYGVCG